VERCFLFFNHKNDMVNIFTHEVRESESGPVVGRIVQNDAEQLVVTVTEDGVTTRPYEVNGEQREVADQVDKAIG